MIRSELLLYVAHSCARARKGTSCRINGCIAMSLCTYVTRASNATLHHHVRWKRVKRIPVIRKLIPHMSQLAESVGKNRPLLNDKLLLMASVCWLARTLMSFYPSCGIHPLRWEGGREGVSRLTRALNPDKLNLCDAQFLPPPIFDTTGLRWRNLNSFKAHAVNNSLQ